MPRSYHPELDPRSWTVAVDPARLGSDETVVAIGRGVVLERFVAWRGADTMTTVGRILDLIRDLPEPYRPPCAEFQPRTVHVPPKVERLIVDEPGLGGGVIDRLREKEREGFGFNEVEAFNGGGGAVGPQADRYLNRRAEAFMHLRRQLEAGLIAVPNDRQLFEELTRITWRPTSAGKTQIGSKDELRRELGRSTDRADAASMFFSPRLAFARPFAFSL